MIIPAAATEMKHVLQWGEESGVIIRGVYEGQTHVVTAYTGKTVGTDIAPVVDIMVSGRIVKGIPVRFLERVS